MRGFASAKFEPEPFWRAPCAAPAAAVTPDQIAVRVPFTTVANGREKSPCLVPSLPQFPDMRIAFRLNEAGGIKYARSLDLADLGTAMLRPYGLDFGRRIREILLGCAENATKVRGEFA